MRRRSALTILLILGTFVLGLSFQNCSAPVSIKPAEQLSSASPAPDNPTDGSELLCSPQATTSCTGSDPNGVYSKTCDSSGTSYSACSLTSCKNGYSLVSGECTPAPAPVFNPATWAKLDSNSIFDFNNGGRIYYINGKIVILFMTINVYFYVYDIGTKTFISTPQVPAPVYPAINDRATSFALGNSLYLILGTTLWEYSTSNNSWISKGTTPGNDHRNAFSFTANGYAYVNGGFYNEGKTFKYSPSNNQWTQVSDHQFTNASAERGSYFNLNNKAYIYDGVLTEYDPATDTWTQKNSTYFAYYAAFTINNKGYLVGSSSQYTSPNKLYSYDSNSNNWVELKDYSPNYFCNLYGVGAGSSAYLFVGGNSNSCELWQLTP